MEITWFNGKYIPKDEVKISPDDRGFLFADGIYEVVRWYEGFFYDMDSHLSRLKRNLRELRINWSDPELYQTVALDLIKKNNLENQAAMVYLQITRGAARRSHTFPSPEVNPTLYAFAWGYVPENNLIETGVRVMLKEDIRWSRCDIKSISLLAHTLSFQEACENRLKEAIFVRNGLITEGSHSNIFFVVDKTLYTHPESNHILSGVTRKNVLRIAQDLGINIREEGMLENRLRFAQESFITNTSGGVIPVTEIGGNTIGEGITGPVTRLIYDRFEAEISALKG
jgi:D-alanine transaminase